jgi:catechol 2,3-dioxygenase-like lactoylglutathione lyase family enzyme
MKGAVNMKRFHIHVGVKDLEKSIQFYSTLFGQKPTKLKEDYAKWMIEDPRLNFAISTRVRGEGVDHLGIQVEDNSELEQITERLKNADLAIYDEGETTCCYAESKKAWVQDPTGIAWEAYKTMGDTEIFSSKTETSEIEESQCCVPEDSKTSCC